ncbi:MAG TPA: DUF1700 domain-containing protein [Acidobacteriaceae bacterium]|nr:DUF1700 domain-containing protein [Acidobacteriaceae bacterium]
MTLAETSARSVEIYLKSLRRELSDLLDEDANEIVEEIRTHIFDKTTGETPESVAATLAALGTPQELADRYRTPELIERARLARSPKYVLRRTMRRLGRGLLGLLLFSVAALGCSLGCWLFLLGFIKLMSPRTTGVYGVWTKHDISFNWQFGSSPNKPNELLGWWLVPIGILLGGAILLLTFRLGYWSIRRFWTPRTRQEA